MFGSNILEVAIGIIFIYLLVSTICSSVREGLESFLKTRAAYLEHGIRQLFSSAAGKETGKQIAKQLYDHPQIYGLFNGEYKAGSDGGSPALFAKGGDLPSYIPSKNFAVALMDIVSRGAHGADADAANGAPIADLKAMRDIVTKLESPVIKGVLLNAIDSAQGDLNKVQANVEAWYNSSMDRVSGWYKRSTQLIIFGIALIITVALNINTIAIANYLTKNDAAAKALVERAGVIAKDTAYVNKNFKEVKADLDGLKLPIGWSDGPGIKVTPLAVDGLKWLGGMSQIVFGLLITAFAATLGAPFWFDILNKVMVIRSTVKPHEKSREEGSQDNPASANRPQIIVNNPAPPPPPPAAAPVVDQEELDNCHFVAVDLTDDEELPIAVGGVAPQEGGLV